MALAERVELKLTSRAAGDDQCVLKAVMSGYFHQCARLDRSGNYHTLKQSS